MSYIENLKRVLNDSKLSDIEIYAHTNISTPTLSNMRTGKYSIISFEHFSLLKELLKKEHDSFLEELFGSDYFSEIHKFQVDNGLTSLGNLFVKNNIVFNLDEKIANASKIDLRRIRYLFNVGIQTLSIEEITKIEIASGLKIGTIATPLSKKFKLNTPKVYQQKLKDKQLQNNSSSKKQRNPAS